MKKNVSRVSAHYLVKVCGPMGLGVLEKRGSLPVQARGGEQMAWRHGADGVSELRILY